MAPRRITAKRILTLTQEEEQCVLSFEDASGSKCEFRFPAEQIDSTIGSLVQVERERVLRTQPGQRYGLRTQRIRTQYSSEANELYLELHVGTMIFPFVLSHGEATGLLAVLSQSLKSN